MMLVDYSSSSDEGDEKDNGLSFQISDASSKKSAIGTSKCEPLPSVPADIMNMFTSQSDSQPLDDPSLHSGRVRAFGHERGNWATHVYIPYIPDGHFVGLLDGLMACMDHGWHPVDDFHISLSRTFPIRYHWIEGLYRSLKSRVNGKRFFVDFTGYKVYVNDEGTRSFFGVNIRNGIRPMKELVEQVDRSLAEYNLPTYYDPPQFHLSLLWRLGDYSNGLSEEEHRSIENFLSTSIEDLSFEAEKSLMKCGNRVYNLPFL